MNDTMLRALIAAQAPPEIPDWFDFTPTTTLPKAPSIDFEYSEHQRKADDWRMSGDWDFAEAYPDLPPDIRTAMRNYQNTWEQHREAYRTVVQQRAKERFFAWRAYYADHLLETPVPVQKRATDFIDTIARLYQAGEQRPGNSGPFEPTPEDDRDTLENLINTAREILADHPLETKPVVAHKERTHEQQRAFNQVLAALRYWQDSYPSGLTTMALVNRWRDYFEIEGYSPMHSEEIERLCERLDIILEGE
jgi:hypothetical protein